jgi:hypothetical protein
MTIIGHCILIYFLLAFILNWWGFVVIYKRDIGVELFSVLLWPIIIVMVTIKTMRNVK